MHSSLFRAPALRRALIRGLPLLAALNLAHGAAPTWLKLEADNFTIYSDAGEKQITACAVKYAAFRAVSTELFVDPGSALPRSTLLLFRSERAFRQHVPESTDSRSTLVNYNVDVDGAPLAAFSLAGNTDRALQMTFEFETIWSLQRLGYAVPLWISQGAGNVLSTLTLRKGECVVGDDNRVFSEYMPWPKLFDMSADAASYRDGTKLEDFSRQSAGLMNWMLFSTPDSRERFRLLATEVRQRSFADAIEQVGGVRLPKLHQTIQRHLRSPASVRKYPFDEKAARARFHVTRAPEAEVLACTADLLAAWDKTGRADQLLDRAQALAPDLPAVKEGNARRMYRRDRADEGVRLYREAIEAGTTNYAAYLRSAEARLDDSRTLGRDMLAEGGPQALVAIEELRRAIALNPGSTEAYRQLGRAFWVAPKVSDADLADLSRGVVRGEAGHAVRFYRALLLSRLGRDAEVDAELRGIADDPVASAQTRESALQQLAHQQLQRDHRTAERLVKEAKYAEALVIARAAKGADAHALVAKDYARLCNEIEEHEAWSAIRMHSEARDWGKLAKAAEAFARRFPNSPNAYVARRMAESAAHNAAATNSSGIPAVLSDD